MVASKYSNTQTDILDDELAKEKYKFDRNAIVPKKFPNKAEDFKYPELGINVGNPVYLSANRDYGCLKPTAFEIPNRFFPRDCSYTKGFPGNYKFNGLNTAATYSNVHKALDEF